MEIGFPPRLGNTNRLRPSPSVRRFEDLDRPTGQRDPVLALRLHARRGNRPHAGRLVDLGPPRPAHFSGPRRSQHEKLERQLDRLGSPKGPLVVLPSSPRIAPSQLRLVHQERGEGER